jgi:hypothetical protein
MFRTVKTMMVAGMIAGSLPLLTETASAQTVGWNDIRPNECQSIPSVDQQGIHHTTMNIYTNTNLTITLVDSDLASAMFKKCDDGTPFWAWWDGAHWLEFVNFPGLQWRALP